MFFSALIYFSVHKYIFQCTNIFPVHKYVFQCTNIFFSARICFSAQLCFSVHEYIFPLFPVHKCIFQCTNVFQCTNIFPSAQLCNWIWWRPGYHCLPAPNWVRIRSVTLTLTDEPLKVISALKLIFSVIEEGSY